MPESRVGRVVKRRSSLPTCMLLNAGEFSVSRTCCLRRTAAHYAIHLSCTCEPNCRNSTASSSRPTTLTHFCLRSWRHEAQLSLRECSYALCVTAAASRRRATQAKRVGVWYGHARTCRQNISGPLYFNSTNGASTHLCRN